MGRKDAFPALECTDLSRLDACIGLFQKELLVIGDEPAALGLGDHLGWGDLCGSIGIRRVVGFHDVWGLDDGLVRLNRLTSLAS